MKKVLVLALPLLICAISHAEDTSPTRTAASTAQCWDGTYSTLPGRGACGGHQGVKEWLGRYAYKNENLRKRDAWKRKAGTAQTNEGLGRASRRAGLRRTQPQMSAEYSNAPDGASYAPPTTEVTTEVEVAGYQEGRERMADTGGAPWLMVLAGSSLAGCGLFLRSRLVR